MRSFIIALLGATIFTVTAAAAQEASGSRKGAFDRIAGRKLYEQFCVDCHGTIGAGDGKAAATAGRVPNFTTPQAIVDFSLERMLNGVAGKHSEAVAAKWKGQLDDKGREQVVSFMREAFMLPAPTEDASEGRAIFAKTCTVCHGDKGNGATWAKNSLNPSPADFTSDKVREHSRRHMINTVTYGSPGTAMQGFSTQLSREQIAAVVDYIRTNFTFPNAGNAAPVDAAPIPENGKTGTDFRQRLMGKNDGAAAQSAMGVTATGRKRDLAAHGLRADGTMDMGRPLPKGLKPDVAAGKKFFEENCSTCHGKEGRGDGPRAYFINPKPADLRSPDARAELNRPYLFDAISMGVRGSEMPAWSKVLSDQQIANVAEYVFRTFIQGPAPADAGAPVGERGHKHDVQRRLSDGSVEGEPAKKN